MHCAALHVKQSWLVEPTSCHEAAPMWDRKNRSTLHSNLYKYSYSNKVFKQTLTQTIPSNTRHIHLSANSDKHVAALFWQIYLSLLEAFCHWLNSASGFHSNWSNVAVSLLISIDQPFFFSSSPSSKICCSEESTAEGKRGWDIWWRERREGLSGEMVPKPVLIEHSCTSLNINWQLISSHLPPSTVECNLNISFKREREKEREWGIK